MFVMHALQEANKADEAAAEVEAEHGGQGNTESKDAGSEGEEEAKVDGGDDCPSGWQQVLC